MQSHRKMIVDTNPNDNDILKSIMADLTANKKVSVNCSVPKLANKIRDLGLSLGK